MSVEMARDGGCGGGEAEPVGGFALGVEFDAIVGLAALLLEAEIAGGVEFACGAEAVGLLNDAWIEEWGAHVEESRGDEEALVGEELGSNFRLAGEEGGEELAAVVGPEGALLTKREEHTIVGVERERSDWVEERGELREPDGFVGGTGRAWVWS